MEMMVSEYCLIGSLLSKGQGSPREKCGRICQKKDYYLKDRFSYHFPLETDRECRMHIFNAKRLNLITELAKIADRGQRSIRLELPRATLFQVENTVQIFKKLWIEAAKGKISKENTDEAIKNLDILYPEGFTRGHFFRGVLT
jgi:putative protease